MPSIKRLQRQFQGIQDVRQPVRPKFHALIGHPDGTTIEDPETAGYVFVRIDGDSNRTRRALCREVLQRYNQPVIVAYSDELPNTLEIIKLDRDAFAPSSGGGSSWDGGAQLGAHAGQHALYGGDTVWVNTKQFLPLRTRPVVPASMRVYVESGAYQYQTGFNYWTGGYSSDMTAQVPAAGLQLYRVIYIDATINTLAYANTATMPIDPYLADFEVVLDLIPTNCVPLSAVRLYNGMTTIAEVDIYDLRSLISSAPGTSSGGGAIALWGNVLIVAVLGGDYTTIQAAINAANSGQLVLVAPGTYAENVAFKAGVTVQGMTISGFGSTIAPISGVPITLPASGICLIKNLRTSPPAGQIGLSYPSGSTAQLYAFDCQFYSNAANAIDTSTADAAAILELNDCYVSGNIAAKSIITVSGGYIAGAITQSTSAGNLSLRHGYLAGNLTHVSGSTILLSDLPTIMAVSGTGTVVGPYRDGSGNMVRVSTPSGSFFDALTDGATGGFHAGAASDVLWHRHASTADVWVTPDNVEIDGTLGIGTAPVSIVGLRGDFSSAAAGASIYATFYTVTVTGATAVGYGAYYQVVTPDVVFTLGEAVTIYAASPDKGAASIITTAYGLKVADITAGGTNYAIYTGLGAVRFGDAVTATILNLTATANQIVMQSAGVTGTLTWTPATSNKVITLPNLTGTMPLGAGTLTVATANSVTVADHTHAITTSTNPGAAAAILASTAAGALTLESLTINGKMGLDGGAVSATNSLTASATRTTTSGTEVGANFAVFGNPGGASSATYLGGAFTARSTAANAQNFTGAIFGLAFDARHQGTATASQVGGLRTQVGNTSTGIITEAIGARILANYNTGGGSIGTNYGIWVENQTAGTIDYGIYIAGADTYALFVDAGLARFDGNGTRVFELPADATDPTGGGGAAAGRIPVLIGGVTKYLAYY